MSGEPGLSLIFLSMLSGGARKGQGMAPGLWWSTARFMPDLGCGHAATGDRPNGTLIVGILSHVKCLASFSCLLLDLEHVSGGNYTPF